MTIRNDTSQNFLSDLGLSSPADEITLQAVHLMKMIRAEREACARIAEDPSLYGYNPDQIGDAIRNRWKNES